MIVRIVITSIILVLLSGPALVYGQILRSVSKDTANGKSKHEVSLLARFKLNGIYDISGGLQQEQTFAIGRIDVFGTDDAPRFWMDMRQSQLRFDGRKEAGKHSLTWRLEGDFQTNSNAMRLRHAWVDYRFLHFGQDWSMFTDDQMWSDIFDWDGPPSGVWIRKPQLRLKFDLEKTWYFEFGAEQPIAEYVVNNDIDSLVTATSQALPDLLAAIKFKQKWGHFRAVGLYRSLSYRSNNVDQEAIGIGVAVTGMIRTHSKKGNPIQVQWVYGQAIGAYLVGFEGLNYDAVPDGNGNLKEVPTMGGWASYRYDFNEHWHSTLCIGFSRFFTDQIGPFTLPRSSQLVEDGVIDLAHGYALINIMYKIVEDLYVGCEYNYGYKQSDYSGTFDGAPNRRLSGTREAQRINFGMFYNF